MTNPAIRDLERRLSRLEELVGAGPEVAAAASAGPRQARRRSGDTDTFWALDGLVARLPADVEHPSGAVMLVGTVTLADGQQAQWQEGAATEDLLDDHWERAADALQALGHPVRLRLIQEVLRGHTTARELADLEDLGTTGQVYHHLRQLVAAGWLRARAGGRHEVPTERLIPLLTTILGARR